MAPNISSRILAQIGRLARGAQEQVLRGIQNILGRGRRRSSDPPNPPPEVARARRPRYVTTISVDFDVQYKGGKRYKKTETREFQTDEHPNVDLLVDEMRETTNSYSPVDEVNETNPVNRRVITRRVPDAVQPLRERRAQFAKRPVISGFDDGYLADGRCVFHALYECYKDAKDCKKLMRDAKYVALAMTGVLGTKNEADYVKLSFDARGRYGVSPNKFLNDPDVAARVQDLLDNGACHNDIVNFCKYIGASCILLDHDNRSIVHSYTAEHASNNRENKPVCVYRISNKHIYTIKDPEYIASVSRQVPRKIINIATHALRKSAPKEPQESTRKKGQVEYVYVEDVANTWLWLTHKINELGSIPMAIAVRNVAGSRELATVTWCKNGRYDLVRYVLNCDRPMTLRFASRLQPGVLCEQDKEIPKDISPTSIVHKLVSKCLADTLPPSRPNPLAQSWFTANGARHRAAHGILLDNWQDVARGRKTEYFDIRKAYSAAMWNPHDEFPVLAHNDAPVPYDGRDIMDLPIGLYLVKTDNVDVLRKDGIYTRKLLQLAHKRGIQFQIVSMIICSRSAPRNALRGILATLVALTEHRAEDSDKVCDSLKQYRKLMCNSLYGILAKISTSKISYCSCSTDHDDVWEYLIRHDVWSGSLRTSPVLIDLPQSGLMVFGTEQGGWRLDHNLPVAFQIQDDCQINLVQMFDDKNGIAPLYYATDATLVLDPKTPDAQPTRTTPVTKQDFDVTKDIVRGLEDSDIDCCVNHVKTWGTYSVAQLPSRMTDTYYASCIDVDALPWSVADWNYDSDLHDSAQAEQICDKIVQNGGCMVKGPSGVGKSTVARAIAKRFKGRCVCLAEWAVAASHLKGMTIAAFVGKRMDSLDIGRKQLAQDLDNTDVIVVDEWSTMTQESLRYLWILKSMKPGLIFVFLGDPEQLKGVEPHVAPCDYFEHPTTKCLANGLCIKLDVQYRSDEKITDMLKQVLENDKFSLADHCEIDDGTGKIAICYTNLVRRVVNEKMMNRYKTDDAVPVPESKDDNSQVWLYPGMPIITTKKKLRSKDDEKDADDDATCPMERFRSRLILYNQQRLEIVSANNETFDVLYTNPNDRFYGLTKTFKISEFREYFDVAYCMTTHKAQGSGFDEPFAIYEYDKMNKELLYTAIGRGTKSDFVRIASLSPDDLDHRRTLQWMDNIKLRLCRYRESDKKLGRSVCNLHIDEVWDMIQDCDEACSIPDCKCALRLSGKCGWTLDRRDNHQGHVRGNVIVTCLECNESHRFEEV
jgi:hypothetical protein